MRSAAGAWGSGRDAGLLGQRGGHGHAGGGAAGRAAQPQVHGRRQGGWHWLAGQAGEGRSAQRTCAPVGMEAGVFRFHRRRQGRQHWMAGLSG